MPWCKWPCLLAMFEVCQQMITFEMAEAISQMRRVLRWMSENRGPEPSLPCPGYSPTRRLRQKWMKFDLLTYFCGVPFSTRITVVWGGTGWWTTAAEAVPDIAVQVRELLLLVGCICTNSIWTEAGCYAQRIQFKERKCGCNNEWGSG